MENKIREEFEKVWSDFLIYGECAYNWSEKDNETIIKHVPFGTFITNEREESKITKKD